MKNLFFTAHGFTLKQLSGARNTLERSRGTYRPKRLEMSI
jgi:hypothetical protein